MSISDLQGSRGEAGGGGIYLKSEEKFWKNQRFLTIFAQYARGMYNLPPPPPPEKNKKRTLIVKGYLNITQSFMAWTMAFQQPTAPFVNRRSAVTLEQKSTRAGESIKIDKIIRFTSKRKWETRNYLRKKKKGHDILWKSKWAKHSSKTNSSIKTKLGGH